MNKLRKNENGFTLIEILASIVILTIILTVFLKFFVQAMTFATKNEEMLEGTNDARQVLSLLQENYRAVDLLKSYGIVDSSYKVKKTTVTNTTQLKQLLDPWNQTPSAKFENMTIAFSEGDKDLIQADINVFEKGTTKVLSKTYGFIPKNAVPVTFYLRNLPTSSSTGELNIWTGNSVEEIFIQPASYDVMVHMKNSYRIPYGIHWAEGDLTYLKVKHDIDQYNINATLQFTTSATFGGGYGILLDGSLTKPIEAIKQSTPYKSENGYMVLFDQTKNEIRLSLRKNGHTQIPQVQTFPISSLTYTKGNSSMWKWDAITKIEIQVANAYSKGFDSNPLTTRRVYSVFVNQGDTLSASAVFNQASINTNMIHEYDTYSKYIGLRLWSNNQFEHSSIKIFR
ncbi:type II secretion system GspH family protein [Bacillus timonensis]|nr:type II secretion system GspH family protein [Bacillus timonensis]